MKFKIPLIRTFIILSFISLSFLGADCNKLLNSNSDDIADVVGNWRLVQQSGAAFDVCDGETIQYSASHVALLQCPSQTAISRTVTVTNGTITYDETGIIYNYTVNTSVNPAQLSLTGSNVSRNLVYNMVITTADSHSGTGKDTKVKNSSDNLR